MSHQWDQFSKSLAEESLPRRESLRLLGAAFAGAVLSPWGLGPAWAAKAADPCKTFCKCSNKRQQNDCLAACRACNKDTSRLCGSCGNYTCADLVNDVYNCGACGYVCDEPDRYEYGACLNGRCEYACVEGAMDCGWGCTPLDWDPNNCGACGYVCGGLTPYCNHGVCSHCRPGLTNCSGYCRDLGNDPANCGACGVSCGIYEFCSGGECMPAYEWWQFE